MSIIRFSSLNCLRFITFNIFFIQIFFKKIDQFFPTINVLKFKSRFHKIGYWISSARSDSIPKLDSENRVSEIRVRVTLFCKFSILDSITTNPSRVCLPGSGQN